MSRLWVLDVWRNTKHWLRRSARILRSLVSRRLEASCVCDKVINEKGIENKIEMRRELFHSCKHFACSKFGLMTLCMCTSIDGRKGDKKTFASRVKCRTFRRETNMCSLHSPSAYSMPLPATKQRKGNSHLLTFLSERRKMQILLNS